MNKLGSITLPSASNAHDVLDLDFLRPRLPADQLDAFASLDVYCRHYLHIDSSANLTKLLSSLSPGAPLFSGWNCTPYVFPFLTAEGNLSPYSLSAISTLSAGRPI